MILNTTAKREQGRKAQLGNIQSAKAISDIVRTTLGPRAMLKMLLDPMGGLVMTNDGNAILREIDVTHPAAKSMIELARTQDEEVGDGTTSVIILAGEMLSMAQPLILRNMHPRVIVHSYMRALEDAVQFLEQASVTLDVKNTSQLLNVVKACVGTKFSSRFGDQIASMALTAVQKIAVDIKTPTGSLEGKVKHEIDIKRFARVEKIPGGFLEESTVLNGVMLNKDVVSADMKRKQVNPRILLMDCGLEYKKGESPTNLELAKESDFETLLKMEEEAIEKMCKDIIKHRPTLVFTEKGVSDLAQHYLAKAGISVIRRLRKTDNDRIARAVGATIVHEPAEIQDKDIGTGCGLFEIRKIGDEYFTFLVECKDAKACTVVLRGGSKDVLNELERNLQDAMAVARNIMLDPRVVPGGGAVEMAVSKALYDKAKTLDGVQQWPYRAVAQALEVIPRTLIENCGASTIRLMTQLRAEHTDAKKLNIGVDGNKGLLVDMATINVWEPLLVKSQTYKTAIESSVLLLRIDDIVSGVKKGGDAGGAPAPGPEAEDETFGDNRDG